MKNESFETPEIPKLKKTYFIKDRFLVVTTLKKIKRRKNFKSGSAREVVVTIVDDLVVVAVVEVVDVDAHGLELDREKNVGPIREIGDQEVDREIQEIGRVIQKVGRDLAAREGLDHLQKIVSNEDVLLGNFFLLIIKLSEF